MMLVRQRCKLHQTVQQLRTPYAGYKSPHASLYQVRVLIRKGSQVYRLSRPLEPIVSLADKVLIGAYCDLDVALQLIFIENPS